MKVLYIGGFCGVNILKILIHGLKSVDSNISISVLDPKRADTKVLTQNDSSIFDNVFYTPPAEEIFKNSFHKAFLYISTAILNFLTVIRFLFRYEFLALKKYLYMKSMFRQNKTFYKKLFSKHDIIHLHFISPEMRQIISLLPNKKPLIASFWGSDLFRTAGIESYEAQLSIINRADVVTLHSLAMREIYVSKFGRKFYDKVSIMHFGYPRDKASRLISDESGTTSRCVAKCKWANPSKVIIRISYNADEEQQHIPILKQIARLPESTRNQLHIWLPLTYGGTPEYIDEVKSFIDDSDLSVTVFEDYIENDLFIEYEKLTSITIHLPISDSFNLSMIEALLTGSILITGAWLHYDLLDEEQISYFKLYKLDSLHKLLERIIYNKDKIQEQARQSNINLINAVDNRLWAKKWRAHYEQTLQRNQLQKNYEKIESSNES